MRPRATERNAFPPGAHGIWRRGAKARKKLHNRLDFQPVAAPPRAPAPRL